MFCILKNMKKIKLHYKEDKQEQIWTNVQLKYVNYLSTWRTDLGGKKNFHNFKGKTYDYITLRCYYAVCKDVSSLNEIEEMENNLILISFKKFMYKAFKTAEKKSNK